MRRFTNFQPGLLVLTLATLALLVSGVVEASVLEMENEHLKIVFSGGTIFRMLNQDGAHLLFPGNTSPLVVRLNGVDTVLAGDNFIGAETLEPGSDILLRYRLPNNCLAEVRYVLAGPAVRIMVSARNRSGRPVRASARILLDTQIGPNDGSPFFVPGIGLVTREREWAPPPFTDWFSYDRYPNPRISGYGRLETVPDRLVLACWRSINLRSYRYTPRERDFTSDSALLAYYDLGLVAPGSSSRVVTLAYGAGPPAAVSREHELAAALRLAAEAARLKLSHDLEVLVEVDAAAVYAVTDGKAARRHLLGWLGGDTTGQAQVAAPLIIGFLLSSELQDALGSGVSIGFGLFNVAHRALTQGRLIDRRYRHLAERFSDYADLWAGEGDLSPERLRSGIRAKLLEKLEAPAGLEDGPVFGHRLRAVEELARKLEEGELELSPGYPYEEVLDCLARTQTATRNSTEYETTVVSPLEDGTGISLSLLGTLAPISRQVRLDSGEARARRLETGSNIAAWSGTGLGIGTKVVAAVLTLGKTTAVELVIGGVATGYSMVLRERALHANLASDARHVLWSGFAAANFHREQEELAAILDGMIRGVPQARGPDIEPVSIEGLEVWRAEGSGKGLIQVEGEIRLANPNPGPVPASVMMTVSGLGADQPPVAVPAAHHQTLTSGRHRLGFSFPLLPFEQVRGLDHADIYWLRAQVGTGWRDIRVDQTFIGLALADTRSPYSYREIGRGELATGETETHETSVDGNTRSAVFYLSYEGSRLTLEVIDPAGRRIGYDYARGEMRSDIPGADYDAGPDSARVRIPDPAPGRYRLAVHAVAAHLRESYVLGIAERPRSERPAVVIRPDYLMFVPEDDPDLLGFEIAELSGEHPGGDIDLPDLSREDWRVSEPSLPAGGSVQLEVRRPGELWRGGMSALRVRVGGREIEVAFDSAPREIASEARVAAGVLRELREERSRSLSRIGAGRGLWEASLFGELSDPALEEAWEDEIRSSREETARRVAVRHRPSRRPRRTRRVPGEREPGPRSFTMLIVGIFLFVVYCLGFIVILVLWLNRGSRAGGRGRRGAKSEVPLRAIRIGRAPKNDVVLPDRSVSRRHAVVRPLPDGTWEVEDLGSKSGTWIDGIRVTRQRVTDNSVVRFGGTALPMTEIKSRAEISPETRARR